MQQSSEQVAPPPAAAGKRSLRPVLKLPSVSIKNGSDANSGASDGKHQRDEAPVDNPLPNKRGSLRRLLSSSGGSGSDGDSPTARASLAVAAAGASVHGAAVHGAHGASAAVHSALHVVGNTAHLAEQKAAAAAAKVQEAAHQMPFLHKGPQQSSLGRLETTLLEASETGDSEKVLRLLGQDRSKIDVQDAEGRTPLICAAANNHSVTVLLLLRLGAKVPIRDQRKKTALSHAIIRHNGTLVIALLSALCGLAGSTARKVDAVLSRRESSLMYSLIANLDSVKIGRAAALIFMVNPEVALVTLIRGSTAARDKARLVEGRSPYRAEQLAAASVARSRAGTPDTADERSA
jgi:hypothetical protein